MGVNLGDIDQKLFIAINVGDMDAFEQLFQKYYTRLCDYCENILDNQEQAEDVVQDLFVQLWKCRGEIDIQGAIKSYLFSSAKHRALNVLKHKAVERNHCTLLTEFLEDLSSSEYSEDEMLQIDEIKKILENLPQQCRIVFTMSCLEGKKYKEIADELNISVNTVKSHISKAYRDIRAGVGMETKFILFFVMLSQKFYFTKK